MEAAANETAVSNQLNAKAAFLIIAALIGAALLGYYAFQRHQEEKRIDEMKRWYADQERHYFRQLEVFENCKSEAEHLRSRGHLVAGAKKDLKCLDLQPIPLHRELFNILEEQNYHREK